MKLEICETANGGAIITDGPNQLAEIIFHGEHQKIAPYLKRRIYKSMVDIIEADRATAGILDDYAYIIHEAEH